MSTQTRTGRDTARAWKVAACVMGLALVGLIAYLLLTNREHDVAADTPPTAAATEPAAEVPLSSPAAQPPATASTAWAEPGCNGSLAAGNPATSLSQANWTPFLSAALPSSATLGPTRTESTLRRCFQHGPAGAVMAAANFALTPLAPNGQEVVEAQWTAGPGRTDMLAALSSWSGTTAEIVAYRISACEPQACNVTLVVFGSGRYATSQMPLVWRTGDWMVDGSAHMPAPGLVPSIPPGYTAWSASS